MSRVSWLMVVSRSSAGLSRWLTSRRADDLLSRLATSHTDDTLTEEEMVSTALVLFIAGFETTTNLLGNGLHALLSHPDQLARLRADPDLIPTAVEELLRWESPVQVDARTVLEPTTLAGAEPEPGSMVLTLLGAANHDPDRFTDPHRLDTARTGVTHLAFASGIHFCLGAHLTRLEATVFFDRLLTRFPSIEQIAPPRRRAALALRGFAAFPLALQEG